jgi:hypothetical protein
MNPEALPPNLRDLEELLARRPGPEPAADHRGRILGAIVSAETRTGSKSTGRHWRIVWQAAAAVIIALNLGMSAANGVRFERLRELVQPERDNPAAPGLSDTSETNDSIDAIAGSAWSSLRPAPDAGALGRNLFSHEEERRWAMP